MGPLKHLVDVAQIVFVIVKIIECFYQPLPINIGQVIQRIDPNIINMIPQPIDDLMYVIEERNNIILSICNFTQFAIYTR